MSGGAFHPLTSGGASQSGQKIALSLTIPRGAPTIVQTASSSRRPFSGRGQRPTVSRSYVRKPKYVSPAAMGGYLVLKTFANGQWGQDQTFTMGFSGTNFLCYFSPPLYNSANCYNAVPIYVAGGSDTFYAEVYDASNHLLSVTPGLYSFYGAPPAPYTVPYAGTIAIDTYGYAAQLSIEQPSACADPAGTTFHFSDADSFIISGPLANPVSVSVSGGFSVAYSSGYALAPIGTSYTIYNTEWGYGGWGLTAPSVGTVGTIAATTPSGSLPVNFPTIYAVDHTALTATPGGLYALGLVGGGTTSYACGKVNIIGYTTGSPWSSPVAVTNDQSGTTPSVFVLDDASANPTVDVIPGFILQVAPGVGALVSQVSLPSTGGLDIAASGATSKAYVLNSDGSLQVIDYTNGAASFYDTAESGMTTPAGSSLGVYEATASDYVFVSTYAAGGTLYEIDNANTTSELAFSSSPLSGQGIQNFDTNLSSSAVSAAVAVDQTLGWTFIRGFDPVGSAADFVLGAYTACCPGTISEMIGNSIGTTFEGPGSLAALGAYNIILFSETNGDVDWRQETSTSTGAQWMSLTTPATRVITSSDNAFVGLLQGTTFNFYGYPSTTGIGSLTGSYATLLTGPFAF